ncbi:MAG: type II toxin-antitoxin system RelE/ParE family toxin [Pirellulaceae bacterium]|nr:type II toxin-antitoxin system RelE/ParE family toxin [Pirellulaceae bacterium]
MAKLIISPTARQDLLDICDYITRDKPLAALSWVEKFEEKCKLIAAMPEFGELRPEYGSEVRSSVIGRYVIFYRAIDGGVEVARVIAGDRDIRSL